MANDRLIGQLKSVLDAIRNINKDRLLRPSLGEVALHGEFSLTLEKIYKKVDLAHQYAPEIHDAAVESILNLLNSIKAEMERQVNRSSDDYVTYRAQFLSTIDSYLDSLSQLWPLVVAVAVESRGLLEDEGVRLEYKRTMESIKKESEMALQKVQEEGQKTIEEAKTLAEQIEKQARSTATGISVEEAQKQFREAQSALDRRVKNWALLSIGGVSVFIIVAICFAIDKPSGSEWWIVVYGTTIRITILTAIGTASAFCLKTLRAHMHMSEKNRHRQHVANSIGAFVESAVTPEQRDLILSQLVEAVIQFGNSGLVQREDDNVYRPKVMIDSIGRTLSRNPQKEV